MIATRGMARSAPGSARSGLALAVFCAVGVACLVLVINTLRVPIGLEPLGYSAVFTDIGGLSPGSDVNEAGVRIGTVTAVRAESAGAEGTRAVVDFSVDADHRLASDVRAVVRYGDMLGVRVLAVEPGTPGGKATIGEQDPLPVLPLGEVIPLTRTSPPLDLTAMVNGFKPLFEAIDPSEVNGLTRSLLAALQGQAGASDDLLGRITLVSRDVVDDQQVYARLLESTAALAQTLAGRSQDLRRLIVGMEQVSEALSRGGDAQLAGLVDHAGSTLSQASGLMAQMQAPVTAATGDARSITDTWTANTEAFNATLALAPVFAHEVNRIADHGSFLSLYMCNFTLKNGQVDMYPFGTQHSPVCR